MCFSARNDHEALGLPPGSVRAILALIIMPPIILASISLMILMFINQRYTEALGILTGLTGIAGSVVGYYFGNKSAQAATNEIINSHMREISAKDGQIQTLRGIV